MRKATNIIWDIDPEDNDGTISLPNEIDIPDSIPDDDDEISDYISNVTGYCHKGFCLSTDAEMVLLKIEDPTVDVGEDPLMACYLLNKPNEEKLNELKILLSTAYDEDGAWYDCIPLDKADEFIKENFTVVPMDIRTLTY